MASLPRRCPECAATRPGTVDMFDIALSALAQLFTGLVLGGIFVLLAIGLSLIFGLMTVVNFAPQSARKQHNGDLGPDGRPGRRGPRAGPGPRKGRSGASGALAGA